MEKLSISEASDEISVVSPITGKETWTSGFLGLGFLFVFTSYHAIQNIQGSLNDEGGLGVISLSSLYGAAILSAVYAPTVITLFGVKKSVMIAFAGHVIYTASNFYPSFYTLIPSSIILGALTGPLWTSQGIYLTLCAFSYAERTGMQLFSALSRINGIFFTMLELGNIIGNLISSLVMYQGHYNITNETSSSFCGANDCPSEETDDIIADPEPHIVYIMLGIFLGCVCTGLTVVGIFLPPIENKMTVSKDIINKSVMSWFKLIKDSDIKLLLPFIVYLATEQVFLFAEITKSFVSCPIGIQNIGYVMAAYGVCTTLCTFMFSRIAKYTRRYIMIGFAGGLQRALMLWMYHWVPGRRDSVKIYLLASLWGVAEGIWKTQTNVMLGEIFSEQKQAAFAVYEGVKYLAVTATLVYSSLICVFVKLLIGMITLGVGLVLFALVEIRFARQGRQEKTYTIDKEEDNRDE